MICPNCKEEIEKTSICPHCKFEFSEENIYEISEKLKIPPINLNPLSFRGRIGRLQYFCSCVLLGIMLQGILVIFFLIDEKTNKSFYELASIIVGLFACYFFFALIIKRLRDINISFWTMLLFLVPFVNALYDLYILFAPSNYPDYKKNIKKNE